MRVFHSSNIRLTVLPAGQFVTPDQVISQCFGRDKPGEVHYLHEFEARTRRYGVVVFHGREYQDSKLVGELDRTRTPEGESWVNYKTVVELVPLSVTSY